MTGVTKSVKDFASVREVKTWTVGYCEVNKNNTSSGFKYVKSGKGLKDVGKCVKESSEG